MALSYRIVNRNANIKNPDTGKLEQRAIRIAVQQSNGIVPIEEVAGQIEKETALGFGDVLSILAHLGPIIARYASLGHSVKLDRFGTFTPYISAKAEADPSKDYAADTHIKATNIRFTPDRYLKDETKRFTYRVVSSSSRIDTPPSAPETKEEEGGGSISED